MTATNRSWHIMLSEMYGGVEITRQSGEGCNVYQCVDTTFEIDLDSYLCKAAGRAPSVAANIAIQDGQLLIDRSIISDGHFEPL